MTSGDLGWLEAAFEEARILEGEEREDFLIEFAVRHPDLIDELRALLAADANSANTVADMVGAAVETVARDNGDIWHDQTIGVWTIKRRLGEGGMGSVFLVERTDGSYRQTAALKLTASRLLGDDAHSRFRAERQILANLTHPNIATLIDGGTHEGGMPFLVMEFIEGERIDEHCDAAGLGIEQRLRMFVKVCDAVDYAHRNLVVHRDLKPSNILVAANGEPKLLDFGIAKLLEESAIEMTIMQTREEARAMTPQYASPEQVRGEKVTVGTDVYALGVLLYRLLSGRSPYGSSLTTSREVENAILDQEPTRPSHSLDDVAPDGGSPSAQEIGEQRGLSASELRSRLRGDLDNIVLKCLQKEPDRRYASVRDLTRDIERYLRHEPISARGDDLAYRVRKFARRNARALMATTAVVLGAISIVTFYTLQLAAARDRAELAAARSGQVSGFLTDIFESADPASAPGETVTATQLLEEGAARIDAVEDEAVRAELLRVMGASYHSLGQFAQGEKLLETSLSILRKPDVAEPIDLARTLAALAYVQQDQYKLDEAVESGAEAVSLATAALGEESPQLSYFLTNQARIQMRNQQPRKAMALYEKAIAVQKRSGTFGGKATRDTLGAMMIGYGALGEHQKALVAGKEAAQQAEAADGPLDINTIHAINNLAMSSFENGLYREAVRLSQDAIARGKKLWSGDHPDLAYFDGALGVHANAAGDIALAERAFESARQGALATSGRESSDYVGHLLLRGRSALVRGEIETAKQIHVEGLALSRSLFGADGTLTLRHALHLASAHRLSGNLTEAEDQFAIVWANREKLRPPKRLVAMREKARLDAARGQYEQAAALLKQVLAGEEAGVDAASPALIDTLLASSHVHRVSGDADKALAFASRANAIAEKSLPARSWIAALARAEFGRAQLASGKVSDGERTLRRALSDLRRTFGEDNHHVLNARESLRDPVIS